MGQTIIYIDENDRSYGLSGMAVALALLNHEEKISGINIDRESEAIDFVHEFYFSGNPLCSAKVVWTDLARTFQLSLGMAIGNVIARRHLANNRTLSQVDEDNLRDLAMKEGSEICGFDADEVDEIWNKEYKIIQRYFQHPAVRKVTSEMAEEIRRRRSLSRYEIMELLAGLSGW